MDQPCDVCGRNARSHGCTRQTRILVSIRARWGILPTGTALASVSSLT